MVNEKQTKRERNIKSKLMAAIAMLLVSSIMMVSTTYAWFTLSTAPEVTGITTSIASNGNLEIALSPSTGMPDGVQDAAPGTNAGWADKNLSWGNLVDLGFTGNAYGLDKLTLAPAQLALVGTTGAYTLNDNVLAVPSYGADGRIDTLEPDAVINGKPVGSTGYSSVDADYGVRAVGVASGMSAQASKLKNAAATISSNASSAIAVANNSLTANGNALAAMLIEHAKTYGGTDTADYSAYTDELVLLTSDLSAAVNYIDEALRAALAGAAATIDDETKFSEAIEAIEGKNAETGAYLNTLEQLETQATTLGFTLPSAFSDVLDARDAVASTIASAAAAATTLNSHPEGTKVQWSDPGDGSGTGYYVSTVLNSLMNLSGDIKVSGSSIEDIKNNMSDMDFMLNLATNCEVQLGVGSGVYYSLAEITGNINAKVTEVPVSYQNINVNLKNVFIKTMVASTASTPMLPVMKNVISGLEAGGSENSTQVLDAFYGYVVDLMVRTNAADSYLKLQTAPIQRVYADGHSEATMGGGSTITFENVKSSDIGAYTDMCKAIRVVLFDPSHDNAVFGLAKVTQTAISDPVASGEKDVAGNDIMVQTIVGSLELCEIVEGDIRGTTFEAGAVNSGTDAAKLCDLTQNVAQAISALVYLEGSDITSADVLADRNMSGILNLQFASSATLKPMENSDLRNMANP